MYYYNFNIGDFRALSDGLDDESVGILLRLMNRYASTENPIKTEWVSVAFQVKTQEKALAILNALWVKTEEGFVLPSLSEIIADYQAMQGRNRENGRKGGRPKKNPSETETKPSGFLVGNQDGNQVGCESVQSGNPNETLNHKPLTINHKPGNQSNKYIPASESASASSSASEEPRRAEKKTSVIQKPEGVEPDDWSAFLKLRKEKKMPLTQRALDLMHAEGKKANLSMQQVIVKCLEESWAGFKASWLENKPVEKHEESSIHKVRNPGPPPSKDDDGWKAQEAYFKSLNMFKGYAS